MMDEHSINDLAKLVGVSPRTIRYYIEEGLLPEPHGSGRRQRYGREHEARLRVAKALRDLGLTVKGVRIALASTPIAVLEKRLAALPRDVAPEQVGELLGDLWQSPPPPPAMASRSILGSLSYGEPTPPYRLSAHGHGERAGHWFRVSLAPGVELHYQLSDDERRQSAIEGIVRDAEKRLAPFD
jgi:Ca-activated chloride channel family protein